MEIKTSKLDPSDATAGRWLSIIGIGEDGRAGLGALAKARVDGAALIVGGARHLALVGETGGEKLPWASPFRDTLGAILARRGEPVCVLASGDPFWFGAGNVLAESVPPHQMLVVPAPSVFSLAASRLAWPLQHAVCLGLHTAPVESVRRHLHGGARILALCVDGRTPAKVALFLAAHGFGHSRMHVLEALGGPREAIHQGFATEFTASAFHNLCLVALEVASGRDARPIPFAPGLPDSYFEHDGQLTKSEIRAITLAALAPQPNELLWDVGLGSGSVAIEWLLSHPGTKAIGFERSGERAARAAKNALALGVPHLDIRTGEALALIEQAPAPDAVFVGGGLSEPCLLERCWAALKPGGRLVANVVTLEGEAELTSAKRAHGGRLTRICVEREEAIGRFTCWRPAIPVVQWVGYKPWS